MKKVFFVFLIFSLFFISGCESNSENVTLTIWDMSDEIGITDYNPYADYILWFKINTEKKIEDEYDTINLKITYTLDDGSKMYSDVSFSGYDFDKATSLYLSVLYENNDLNLYENLSRVERMVIEASFDNVDRWDFNNKYINYSISYYQVYFMSDDYGDSYCLLQNEDYPDNNIVLVINNDYEYNIVSVLDISPIDDELFYGDIYYQEEEENVLETILIPYVKGTLYE